MSEPSLGHVPAGERWEFDAEVVRVFDDMLERSIPQYQAMRASVSAIAAAHFGPFGGRLLDLGCSRGAAMAAVREIRKDATLVGLEVSPPMLEAARERFAGDERADVLEHDLRVVLPPELQRFDVVLSVLTLQFVPLEHRQRVVRDAYRALVPGGVFIVVEKILGASADLNELFIDLYLEEKRRAGYSQEEIDRKKAALEGVLVPVTARWNEELLAGAGFSQVDCFWRWMNFAGWIAVR